MADSRKMSRFGSTGNGLGIKLEVPGGPRLAERRRSSSLSDLSPVSYCAVFLPDGAYKTIQVNHFCRTTGQVIATVLEKSNNPRLPEDYRLVIKYADQSDSWLENGSSTELILSPVVVKIFLKLALEQSERFCSLKTKLMKKAKRKAKKPSKDKGPDQEETLRDLHNAWFAGKMNSGPCEKAVLSGKHGDYLIRTSFGQEAYVLVVNDTKTICNFLISTEDDTFRIGQKSFPSLLKLVEQAKLEPFLGNYGIDLLLQYPAPGGIVMEKGPGSPRMLSRLVGSTQSLTPQGSPRLGKRNQSAPTQTTTRTSASPRPLGRTLSEDSGSPYPEMPPMPSMSNSPARGASLDPPTPRGQSLPRHAVDTGAAVRSPNSSAVRGLPPPPQPPPSSAGPPPSMQLMSPRQPSPRKPQIESASSSDSVPEGVDADIALQEKKVQILMDKKKQIQREQLAIQRSSMKQKGIARSSPFGSASRSQSTFDVRDVAEEDDDSSSSRSSSTANLSVVGEPDSNEVWQPVEQPRFERRHTDGPSNNRRRKVSEDGFNTYEEIPAEKNFKKQSNIGRNKQHQRSAKDVLPRLPGSRMAPSKSCTVLAEGAGRPTYEVGKIVVVKGELVGSSSKVVVAEVTDIRDLDLTIQLKFTGDGENSTYDGSKRVTWAKFDAMLASNTSTDSGQDVRGQSQEDPPFMESPDPPMRRRSNTGPSLLSRGKAKSMEDRPPDRSLDRTRPARSFGKADTPGETLRRPKSEGDMLETPEEVQRYSEGAGMPPPPPPAESAQPAPSQLLSPTPKARPRLGTQGNSSNSEPEPEIVQQEAGKRPPRSPRSQRRQPGPLVEPVLASSPNSRQSSDGRSPSSTPRSGSRKPAGRRKSKQHQPSPLPSPLKSEYNVGGDDLYMNMPANAVAQGPDPAASYNEDDLSLPMNTPAQAQVISGAHQGESSTDPAASYDGGEGLYMNAAAPMSTPRFQPSYNSASGADSDDGQEEDWEEGQEEDWDEEVYDTVNDSLLATGGGNIHRNNSQIGRSILRRIQNVVRDDSGAASYVGEQEDLYMAPEVTERGILEVEEDLYMAPEVTEKTPLAGNRLPGAWGSVGEPVSTGPMKEETPAAAARASAGELYETPEIDIARHRAASKAKVAASQAARRPTEELYGVPEAVENLPHKKPSAVILPSGWVKVYNETHKRDYYFHQATRVSSWTLPSDS